MVLPLARVITQSNESFSRKGHQQVYHLIGQRENLLRICEHSKRRRPFMPDEKRIERSVIRRQFSNGTNEKSEREAACIMNFNWQYTFQSFG